MQVLCCGSGTRWECGCATLHWHNSRRVKSRLPSGRYLWISALDEYGTKPKLILCSRIRKLSSKKRAYFDTIRISFWRVKSTATPVLHMAAITEKPVATVSSSRWCHSMRQTSSVWWPVFVLYCVLNLISYRDRKTWRCWTVFSQADTQVNIYYCGNYHLTSRHYQLWRSDCPAPSNKRETAGACHGNLTTPRSFVWARFMATIHLKFIGFNAIEFLQSENMFVLTEALRYNKHSVQV